MKALITYGIEATNRYVLVRKIAFLVRRIRMLKQKVLRVALLGISKPKAFTNCGKTHIHNFIFWHNMKNIVVYLVQNNRKYTKKRNHG